MVGRSGRARRLLSEDDLLLDVSPDDKQYVEDLGLILGRPQLAIANRICREVIPRKLIWVVQSSITHAQPTYLTAVPA